MQTEAFYLAAERGQRFCLFHPAQGKVTHGLVLYIHPFAEEMNRARRMAALQSRALAQTGYAVLQLDLWGCGDSCGDFDDAQWQGWVSDVVHACHWLRNHTYALGGGLKTTPLWLWGLRAGCLLGVSAAAQLGETCNFLFWQPPTSGKLLLQQFLRLKVAGDMLDGAGKHTMEALRQQLAKGTAVEIAGYMLSAPLAQGLEQAELAPPASNGHARRLEWLEVSMQDNTRLGPASAKAIAQWQQSGYRVASQTVQGPAFWQTSEVLDAPALIAATTAALARSHA